jgi:hypothetical protein
MRCGKCDRDKPPSAFGVDAHAPIGLRTVCRQCRAARRLYLRETEPWRRVAEAAYAADRRRHAMIVSVERERCETWAEVLP